MSDEGLPTPRWVRELRRSLGFKTLVLLGGNVYDRYPYRAGGGKAAWVPLRDFLHRSLHDWGYEVVGFYDIVDGLRFPGGDDEARLFDSILPTAVARPAALSRLDPSACLDLLRPALANQTKPCAIVLDHAGLLAGRPDTLLDAERPLFAKISKAAEEARPLPIGGRVGCNALILVTEKANDVPAWLYLRNPRVKVLEAETPSDHERREYLLANAKHLHQSPAAPAAREGLVEQLTALTQGLTNVELHGLVNLSRQEQMPASDPRRLVELYRFGQRSNPWADLVRGAGKRAALQDAERRLTERVKGQPEAIRAVTDLLKRAALGLSGVHQPSKAGRPKGVLFFAGPTGTGKTELAKAIAEFVFGDDGACLRFDMSEYGQEHSDQRFFGSPPGYVGYDVGGELTNKVKARPFSVLLFDEIEKAHPKILDKFLQILDDGRLTSGQGETVYFSECLIVFTSNKGVYREVVDRGGVIRREPTIRPECWRCAACGELATGDHRPDQCASSGCRGSYQRAPTPYEDVRRQVLRALEHYFKLELGRPELYNRLGNNFVVFDYIRPEVVQQIVRRMLGTVMGEVEARRGIRIDFAGVEADLVGRAAGDLELGGRGIGNLVETAVVNPLARLLFDGEIPDGAHVTVRKLVTEAAARGGGYRLEWSIEGPAP